jgi:hypothetical protein
MESVERPLSCPSETENAGKASACSNCPGKALCQSFATEDPDKDAIDIRMKPIKRKIFVISGKGGKIKY